MSEKLTKRIKDEIDPAIMEKLITDGDLSALSPEQRTAFYVQLCQSLKLNPMTAPFQYIWLTDKSTGQRKLTLYAKKAATEQIGHNHKISLSELKTEFTNDCVIVTSVLITPAGRQMISLGAVYIKGQVGDMLGNAILRAETKSYRRGILKMMGLGFMDESELDSVPHQLGQQPIIVGQQSTGLEQWKCLSATALKVLDASKKCEEMGATIEEMKGWLPKGLTSRKELTEEQALAYINDLRGFYLDVLIDRRQSEGGKASV